MMGKNLLYLFLKVEELAIKNNSLVTLEGQLQNSDVRFRAETDIRVVNR